MSGILVYDSNNSGGDWWLDEKDWDALERAGWTVHWIQPNSGGALAVSGSEYEFERLLLPKEKSGVKWLGAKACSAAKKFPDRRTGVKEWARVTGENPADLGCGCCGPPHSFVWHMGPSDRTYIRVDAPETGTLDWGDD